jgi:hypothetical protein
MKEADIKEVCRHLRARAPEEWDQFVKVFNEYTAEAVDAVTEADAANIMTAKGFALANKGWLNVFTHLDVPTSPTTLMDPAYAFMP